MTSARYYSVPALATCALFGGPIAAVTFAAIEARALGRLRRDLPWLVAGLAALLLGTALAAERGFLDLALDDLGTQHLPGGEHLAYRAIALGYFAGYWWLHRHERRALAAAGVAPQPGYAAGLLALLTGLVGGTALLLALR